MASDVVTLRIREHFSIFNHKKIISLLYHCIYYNFAIIKSVASYLQFHQHFPITFLGFTKLYQEQGFARMFTVFYWINLKLCLEFWNKVFIEASFVIENVEVNLQAANFLFYLHALCKYLPLLSRIYSHFLFIFLFVSGLSSYTIYRWVWKFTI